MVLSIAAGAVTGYALSFWRVRGAELLFAVLLVGGFIPYQVFIYPLVRVFSIAGINNSLAEHRHHPRHLRPAGDDAPVPQLLSGMPVELFKAARVDGGGFWRIFLHVMLPMSAPIVVVAAILQVTGIWNDFILGLVFAGRENLPMTVQLNNIVNSTTGERLYNVNMAATILTAAGAAARLFRLRPLVRARHRRRRDQGLRRMGTGKARESPSRPGPLDPLWRGLASSRP